MSTQVTLTLPDQVYHRAKHLAKLTSRDVTDVLVEAIFLPPVGTASGKSVLIVEDDPINLRVFSKLLTKRGGLEVKGTENVEEVMQIAQSGEADLILMDVSLPNSFYQGQSADGIRITQMLKLDPRTADIPVILVTAHTMPGDRENFLKLSSADGYISKPVVDHQEFIDDIQASFRERSFQLGVEISRKVSLNLLNFYYNELKNKRRDAQESEELEDAQESEELREVINIGKYKAICGSVSHGLKGEFMNISSSIQNIREFGNSLSEIQEECDLIERSIGYSQLILRQLLDYLNLGKTSIEQIDIIELIRKTESLVRPRLPSNVELEVAIDYCLQKPMVLGNFEQLMSVLLELTKNATKALALHGGKIVFHIERNDKYIAVSVKDNGTGISDEVKDKLFKEAVSSKRGLGLGLFLSHKVINDMGGKLELNTSSEYGTKFTILIPIANK